MMKLFILFWKRAFDYKGVASRKQFFATLAINVMVFFIINAVAYLFAVLEMYIGGGVMLAVGGILAWGGVLYLILQIFPTIALMIRRLHDHNDKWWYILLGVNPIGAVVLVVFFFTRSITEDNVYRQYDVERGYI